MIQNVEPDILQTWDGELQEIEARLKSLRDRMGDTDMAETAEVRSLLSGAKLQVGQARGQLTPSVSAASRERAESYIKGSPHASPSGTQIRRRGKSRPERG